MTDVRARWSATAAVSLFVGIGAAGSARPVGVVVVAALVGVAASVLMTGTGWPLLAWAFVSATAVGVICSGSASNIGWFALCVLAGWCVIKGSVFYGALLGGASVTVFVVEWAAVHTDPGWSAWIAGLLFTLVICVLGRRQSELLDQLRATQAELADQTRTDERARIARELHDVIAHSLTVSLLHVASARLAVEEDPNEAIAALEEAERLSRDSLSEVRRTVGLLSAAEAADLAPLPGADQLTELIDGFRRAGARIDFSSSGDASGLGAVLGLTVYRITQEALTNAVRHSPSGRISVLLTVGSEQTELNVGSTGPISSGTGGAGMGMSTMAERAEAVGGSLVAGPVADGWRVYARLPTSMGQPVDAPVTAAAP